jgi:hypothetical protein
MLFVLSSPILLLFMYRGKFWGTQAWFFGIEGYVDLDTLETCLFGINLGRLKWSTSGSILSNHHIAEGSGFLERECEALLPEAIDSAIQPSQSNFGAKVPVTRGSRLWYKLWTRWRYREANPSNGSATENRPPPQHDGQERLFTIVDTYSMTVTLFRARRPPVAVIICGSEGGMQRAVLCSYDWRTQTFCRETVLRMKTMVIEKMFRVDRFRFSLLDGVSFRANVMNAGAGKRAPEQAHEAGPSGDPQNTPLSPVSD